MEGGAGMSDRPARHQLVPASPTLPCVLITHPKCEKEVHLHCALCWWREELRKDRAGWRAYQDELAAQAEEIA